MKKMFVIVLLLGMAALAPAGTVPPDSTIFPGLIGQQLLDSLYTYYHSTSNLGYDNGRDTAYGLIDKDGNDSLRCIYSGHAIYMQPGQDPSTWAYDHGINCEHSWPQSSFNQAGVPRGDLNHLFASQYSPSNVNGDRGDLPFRAIPDAAVSFWYRDTVKTSTAPADSVKDQYSRLESSVSFRPRRVQEGNTARAIFYFYNMYRPDYPAIETWWQIQLPYINDLLQWHMEDPADAAEIARTRKIATYQQGKKNPYILDSTLVRRAYFPSTPTNTVVTFNPVAATRSEAAGACSLSVSIANPNADSATTVDVVCAGGTGDTADVGGYTTQTVTFTANSSTPQVVPISIRDDTLAEGTETVVFKLRNAAGGSGAAVGGDSAFTLTINDNDTPVGTTVSFSPVSLSKTEGDAPFNITVAIANPSSSAATMADVVLAGGTGDTSDIDGYTPQTVTFPTGSAGPQTVPITITDDALVEGTETLVFKLRNVTGGSGAVAGPDSAFTLTLSDNDATGVGGQVIGAFPDMDGGFETQLDTLSVVSTINSAQARWTVSAATGAVPSSGGRSGPKHATFTQTGTSHKRLQSPTVATMAASTPYIVQFYYQGDLDGGAYGDIRGAVCQAGTSGPAYGSYVVGANTGPVWTKYTAALTTNGTAPTFGLGIVSVNNTAQFYIDDFVVYPGSAADVVPPNAPTGVSVNPGKGSVLSLSWGAPAGGVDGGGYLVVRGTSDPAVAPNVNGIYSRGNPIDAGVVAYIGAAVSFSDTGLAPATPYYYRVYAVDKAFNYSTAATGNGITGVSGRPTVARPALGLDQNSPNPFRSSTAIRYSLEKPSTVRLVIYNVLGQAVFATQPRPEAAGAHAITWNGRGVPQGMYFFQLVVDNDVVATRRMTMIK